MVKWKKKKKKKLSLAPSILQVRGYTFLSLKFLFMRMATIFDMSFLFPFSPFLKQCYKASFEFLSTFYSASCSKTSIFSYCCLYFTFSHHPAGSVKIKMSVLLKVWAISILQKKPMCLKSQCPFPSQDKAE